MTRPIPSHLKFPGLRDVYRRPHHRRQNAIVVIYGETGAGKSYLSMLFAILLDITFLKDILRNRVIFHPLDFLKLLMDGKYPKSSVVIIEELGVSLYSRDWYTKANKQIIKVLQTFRKKRLIVIFNVPSLAYIDTHSKPLINFMCEALYVDYHHFPIMHVFRFMRWLGTGEKPYPYFYLDELGIKQDPIRMSGIPLGEMTKEYEKMADAFKDEVIANAAKELEKLEREAADKEKDVREIAEKVLSNIDEYLTKKGKIDLAKIEAIHDIGGRRSKQVRAIIQKIREKQKTGEDFDKEYVSVSKMLNKLKDGENGD